MKDDPDDIAMTGGQRKCSPATIAAILLAAAVIGVLLFAVPGNGIISETHVTSHAATSHSAASSGSR